MPIKSADKTQAIGVAKQTPVKQFLEIGLFLSISIGITKQHTSLAPSSSNPDKKGMRGFFTAWTKSRETLVIPWKIINIDMILKYAEQ